MELMKTIKPYLIGAAILVGLAGSGSLGYWIRGNQDATQITSLEERLETCESEQQQAIRDGADAAGWIALYDKQLGESEAERKQLKIDYDDTLRVIRAMLPDRAERAIAAYYQNRQNTGRQFEP